MIELKKFKQKLDTLDVFTEDPLSGTGNARYFDIVNFPEVVSRGKTSFLIGGTPYLKMSTVIKVEVLDRGFAWLDTGTHESLLEASSFIETIQKRQGQMICCPEEIAFKGKLISKKDLEDLAQPLLKNYYGQYLLNLLND